MIDEWYPDPDVDCALPDMRYPLALMLGAVVIAAALAIAAVKRVRRG